MRDFNDVTLVNSADGHAGLKWFLGSILFSLSTVYKLYGLMNIAFIIHDAQSA
ncbi:MAG: hypothetical protein H6567_10340 [Lewinellaceae bacterium]|nr:hypothetical protein [Lewinellaceae bacterium]